MPISVVANTKADGEEDLVYVSAARFIPGQWTNRSREGLVQDSLNPRFVEVVRELRYQGRRRRVWDDGPGGWEEITVPSHANW